MEHFPEHPAIQAAFEHRQQQRPGGADAGGLRRGGEAKEYAAEHREDQKRRRQNGDEQIPHRGPVDGLALASRGGLRLQQPDAQQVSDVEAAQQGARKNRAQKQVADAHGHAVRHQHQHDARRNQDAQGADGAHRARGQRLVIALVEHHRQSQQRQQHHGGADDAGGRRQQQADEGDGDGQPAAHPTEQAREAHHQLIGDAGAVEQQAHEDEHGQGDHHPVLHHVPGPVHHQRGVAPVDGEGEVEVQVQDDGERREQHRQPAKNPSHRKAGEDQADEAGEHEQRQRFIRRHGSLPPLRHPQRRGTAKPTPATNATAPPPAAAGSPGAASP